MIAGVVHQGQHVCPQFAEHPTAGRKVCGTCKSSRGRGDGIKQGGHQCSACAVCDQRSDIHAVCQSGQYSCGTVCRQRICFNQCRFQMIISVQKLRDSITGHSLWGHGCACIMSLMIGMILIAAAGNHQQKQWNGQIFHGNVVFSKIQTLQQSRLRRTFATSQRNKSPNARRLTESDFRIRLTRHRTRCHLAYPTQ